MGAATEDDPFGGPPPAADSVKVRFTERFEVLMMGIRQITTLLMAAGLSVLLPTAPLFGHELSNLEHTHVYQQSGYGTQRQGHAVNGPHGSIRIWSAKPHTGYQGGQAVQFARPVPYQKKPNVHGVRPSIPVQSVKGYGKLQKRDYGK